jgi:hypothetical protein
MHRLLRPGGEALVIDMRNDVADAAIDEVVESMKLGRVNAFITDAIFKHVLRKRAYSTSDMLRMAAATPFGTADITQASIGFEARFRKAIDK